MLSKAGYYLRSKDGGDNPDDKKKKMPAKTCGDGSKTKYGAPTGDKEFSIGSITKMRFNDNSMSFEFQVEHFFPNDPMTHFFWITWNEMNTFSQYQVAFWFYLRNNHVGGDAFEAQVPSSTAVRALENSDNMEDDEHEAGSSSSSRPTAGTIVGRGHTVFDSSDEDI